MRPEKLEQEPQIEFSKIRMAALRVVYFLVGLGVIYLAREQLGFSASVFLVAALILLAILIASYSIQLRLVYSVAYRRRELGPEAMVGVEGWAIEDLCPFGKVKVRGEIWNAKTRSQPIKKGERMVVVALEDGLTLLVDKPSPEGK